MKSQNAQFTCARLTSGRVVKLTKDCECRTHGSSHWQETDHAWKAANRAALGENPSALALLGYAMAEADRQLGGNRPSNTTLTQYSSS